MPAETEKKTLSLTDYSGLMKTLSGKGLESVVIGGCAVGAYARLRGKIVLSTDLDLLASRSVLRSICSAIVADGGTVQKMPRPRNVPVAVLQWRGKEVNVLTSTEGLPPAEIEARVAREFFLPGLPDVPVLVVDPYDLLRNKLTVNRAKDQAHIAILREFLVEEVVHAFETETDPRKRIGPAARLLDVTRENLLDDALGARLVPLARVPADFHFLAHRLADRALVDRLVARATTPALKAELQTIVAGRKFRRRRRVG